MVRCLGAVPATARRGRVVTRCGVSASATGYTHLMNNRQTGRRRGRGGQRPQGAPGNAGGARDNRQRGNAAQLLEKYKGLARDAQLSGDRVQTEYYLQFADHYFRVLSENRSRFEEQRRGREDYEEDEDLDEEVMEAEGDERPEPRPSQRDQGRGRRNDGDGEGRRERFAREDRPERRERRDRFNGERYNGGERDEVEAPTNEDEEPRLVADILPPAIGVTEDSSEPVEAAEEEAPRPRRRTRRPRAAEGGEEIAPAA